MQLKVVFAATLFAAVAAVGAGPAVSTEDVIIENEAFRLLVGADAMAKSLVVKATGEECLDAREGIPLFTSTQERPFNNEIKLAHPNKRTTYRANRVRREGDLLVVGFAVEPYEAVVRVTTGGGYALFTLEGFRTDTMDEKQYRGLRMDVPPVASFRVVQLPVRNRANFGDWLNVSWDDRAAVAVVGADPYSEIDHEDRFGFRLLNADLRRDIRLCGGSAAIVAAPGRDAFLAVMDSFERDLGLPHGVESRRNPLLNASIYWTDNLTPQNVDEHIAWAKKGGFRMMLIYYSAITSDGSYSHLGDYDWSANYPNREKDLRDVLSRIKAAGITPGFHTLQTHIGLKSRYVTPDADPRLNKTMRFTLAKPLPDDAVSCDVEVLEDTSAAVRCDRCRILQFGGELLSYEGFTKTPPYRFTGVERGHCGTRVRAHQRGEIGGILDVSEFCAISCYIDQRTDLQDEIAAKIKNIYDCGFEFCYFDGSEGVNPPCGVNVSLSQWRVAKTLGRPPLFTEGAAKSHFGWHLQAGANAFDAFRPEVFKRKIVEYPLMEAPIMRQDFTRVDFGWWGFWKNGEKVRNTTTIGTQPDMWEYGTSKAAAWDCPATIQAYLEKLKSHARADDIMETMRRWEDVRARNLLTKEQKEVLKDPDREFHLVQNGSGSYDLVEWEQIAVAGGKASDVRAFLYERGGRRIVEYWHVSGSATLVLRDGTILQAGNMNVFETSASRDAVKELFANGKIKNAAEEPPMMMIRLRAPHTADDAQWGKTLKVLGENRGACDEVWFSTGIGFPKMEWHETHVKRLKRYAEQLRSAGIVPSLQFQATIGHGDSASSLECIDGKRWGGFTGRSGIECKACNCPRQPGFLAYMREMARLYASFLPGSVWIDDDLRIVGHSPAAPWEKSETWIGCWCPTCIAAFNAESGGSWTRESLDAAMAKDPALFDKWEKFSFDGIAAVAMAIADETHRVSPETRLAYQHGCYRNDSQLAVFRAMHEATGLPVGARIAGGGYYDTNPGDLMVKAFNALRQRRRLGDPPWIGAWCPEIETYPRAFASRTAQGLLYEAFVNLAMGMNCISMLIMDTRFETDEWYGENLLAPLAAERPLFETYRRHNRGTLPAGLADATTAYADKLYRFAIAGIPVLPGPGKSCGEVTDADLAFVIEHMSTSHLISLRRSLDKRTGGKTPVVVETPSIGLVIPRVAEDGTLRSVALLNARIDMQKPVRLRLRGVPPDVRSATWWALRDKPVALAVERLSDGDAAVTVPELSAWNCGWLAL